MPCDYTISTARIEQGRAHPLVIDRSPLLLAEGRLYAALVPSRHDVRRFNLDVPQRCRGADRCMSALST
jgi:hypothetical protein